MIYIQDIIFHDQNLYLTKDDCIFVSVGYYHPSNLIHSFLLYVPFREKDKDFKIIKGKKYFKINKIKQYVSMQLYRDIIAEKYPHYLLQDKNLGEIITLKEKDIAEFFEPSECLKKHRNDEKIKITIDMLLDLFDLDIKDIGLSGSYVMGASICKDLDIIVYGHENAVKVKNKIEKIITLPEHQYMKYGRVHQRLFWLNNNLIDIHFLFKQNENIPLRNFKILEESYQEIEDIIIDDSFGMHTPSIYELEKNGKLITYHLGHRMAFKPGQKLKFKAFKSLVREWDKIFKAVFFKPLMEYQDLTVEGKYSGRVKIYKKNKG